jgi:uncharacterized phage protein (TIGR02218 family)
MNRNVPAALQTALDSGVTTLCVLLKITPQVSTQVGSDVVADPVPLGLTSLDVDVDYDDGASSDGELTYVAGIGAELSNAEVSADMAIDNAEASALVAAAEFDLPATEADLVSGLYDYATWIAYLVNYEDLTMGHVELGRGTLGQVRVLDNGQRFTFETLGLTQPLKQSIVQKDSLRCRARFGSQPVGTVGAESTERQPCGFDPAGLWVNGTVTSVSAEPEFTFDTDLAAADDAYAPGLLHWITGSNAGRRYEVESYASGVVTSTFPMTFPVEVGDTFEIRPDCTHWMEGDRSCQTYHGVDWVLHYRGEPYIPVGEQDRINIPGANG